MLGTFIRRANGKNSVVTEPDGETLLVAERNSMHALNGDKVRVIVAARRRGVEPEGEVIEIVEGKTRPSSAPSEWSASTPPSRPTRASSPPI